MREQLLTLALQKAMDLIAKLEEPNQSGSRTIVSIRDAARDLRKEINRLLT